MRDTTPLARDIFGAHGLYYVVRGDDIETFFAQQ